MKKVFTVKEFLEMTYDCNLGEHDCNIRPRCVCKDGFNISIQGGTSIHYCEPRKNCNDYWKLELGYPSELIPELSESAEDTDTTDTVWGYVPIEEVEKLIEKHGGIIGMLLEPSIQKINKIKEN